MPTTETGDNSDKENLTSVTKADSDKPSIKEKLTATWPKDHSADTVLIDTLLKERDEGRQSDSGFKSPSFIACSEALFGSEKISGGIAKSASCCQGRWATVCLAIISILLAIQHSYSSRRTSKP